MLTDAEINTLLPGARAYKKSDEKGLSLHVSPAGARSWRLKYRFHGVERSLTLGRHPEITLREARARCARARVLLAQGRDPMAVRRQEEAEARLAQGTTFRVVADEFIAKLAREGKSPGTLKKARWFADLLQPGIGRRPIADIGPHELLAALRKVESRGNYETALRLRSFAGRVFRYACATLRAERDPASVLRGALTTPRVRHHAAILEPKRVGELLRAIEGYGGRRETGIALLLMAHLFLRPGELRQGEWSEIDFEERVWRVPAGRMKMGRPHVVPLSSQACDLLQQLRALDNPGVYLFPHYIPRCVRCLRTRSTRDCGASDIRATR